MNENCVTAKTLQLMQVIIAFCILAITTSLFSFVLDIIAPRKRPLWKVLKRYAFGYIFTGRLHFYDLAALFTELCLTGSH